MPDKRYAPQQDTDGRWFVLDLWTEDRVQVRDTSLVRMSREEAADAVELLNMVDHLRRERPSQSPDDYVQSVGHFLAPIGWSR